MILVQEVDLELEKVQETQQGMQTSFIHHDLFWCFFKDYHYVLLSCLSAYVVAITDKNGYYLVIPQTFTELRGVPLACGHVRGHGGRAENIFCLQARLNM